MQSKENVVCKHCRRAGGKLFLKGERCFSPKCSFTRRSYAPGMHGTSRVKKISDYGKQLREKQKAKNFYGVRETQFRNYYLKAAKTKEATGEKLLQLLESRLDNVVRKLGLALSTPHARQMVKHGKIKVNDKKVYIPSFNLKEKDKIGLIDTSNFKLSKTQLPVWLEIDKKTLIGKVVKIPTRGEIGMEIDEGLIVEFYSR